MTIRLAKHTDAEELARLSSLLGYPISADELARILAVMDLDKDHSVFVADKGQARLAGFGHVFLTRRLFLAPFAELGGLIVEGDSRGEGLGAALLEAAEDWAQNQGVSVMRIRSNLIRENAREFYFAQGYRDSKKQTVFMKSFTR